jgi:hypothetical protein
MHYFVGEMDITLRCLDEYSYLLSDLTLGSTQLMIVGLTPESVMFNGKYSHVLWYVALPFHGALACCVT